MDKVETKQTVKEERTHRFYCDDCKKLIMESNEYDDGYYDTPYICHVGLFTLRGHYCEECGQDRVNGLIEYAKAHGFDI